MVKNHMKRLTMPTTWKVLKKAHKFITRPKPSGHSQKFGISINTLLKEILHITNTTKETKYLLTKQEVQINGTRKRSHKFQVGFMDIITVPSLDKHYRLTFDTKGKIQAKEITAEESKKMFVLIKGKTNRKHGKTQINTLSGINLREDNEKSKEYKTGDTLILSLPEKKIIGHIKKEKGNQAFIFTGKYAGKTGILEEINAKTAKIKTTEKTIETNKDYLIITGTKKSELNIEA